ncbi:galactose-1-phosphate uridylyltransferase [Cordyceps fumosorosea ARSEF 2679]|uniref:Delta(24)-sterol reductase n=1 Tax=Cordyceps fumosorosea (strain ARSEF 2679) TaxID=1081104 RepID=A0A167VU07_CORFA|nr:galactose-1-phosphate uridylyltransferase [Cordyceps fumosorosea ARSEF 2679]OAA62979.1 galactose-1-phosphate uridylyltransferase [Cordyceps fumosorosea ARSEF 2679]
MERHKQAVSKIAAAVRGFFDRRESYRIFHGSTNSTRPRPGPGQAGVVDISALRNVLSVDRAARTALVEPNVPMDRLVEATLPHGLVPPVVMEFPGITAGGGYAGTAGESSSFRHGFFDETVNYVEMVLGDGEVVRASRKERADLFRGAAGAVGTLGVTTLMELRLVEARRYVRTTYHRTSSVAEAVARVRAETEDPENDYVDGILFGKDHGVVVTGRMTDELPEGRKPQTFSRALDPWFYLHARDRTKALPSAGTVGASGTATSFTDYVPLAEYLFRYDRAGFWVGAQGWTYFKLVPFNRWTRWFLDDFIHTRMMYRALHASGESARFVVQDLGLPYHNAEAFIDYTADKFNIWPLWLCPLKPTQQPTFHPHTGLTEPVGTAGAGAPSAEAGAEPQQQMAPMLNIGLWGWGPADFEEFVDKNRDLEVKLQALGGRKWLYAHTYYDEEDFWKVYDKPWYTALREKYAATTLPTVYDKVRIDVEANRRKRQETRQSLKGKWPVGGLYGIWKAIQSGDYHLHRRAEWKYKGEKK